MKGKIKYYTILCLVAIIFIAIAIYYSIIDNKVGVCLCLIDVLFVYDILTQFELFQLSKKLKQKNNNRGFECVEDSFKKTKDVDTKLPTRATKKSMAYDFYSNQDYVVKPNEIVKIWTDVKAYMGDNECLILNVRSSMGGKFMLANTQGWIDVDYYSNKDNDGNIGIFLKNISDVEQHIYKGDRIAQGAFFNFLISDNGNTEKERQGGFGSTNA